MKECHKNNWRYLLSLPVRILFISKSRLDVSFRILLQVRTEQYFRASFSCCVIIYSKVVLKVMQRCFLILHN